MISLCCLSARVANVVMLAGKIELTSNAAVLLSRNRSLRGVILKPHIHFVASPVRQSRSTLDHLRVSLGPNLFDVLTFSLVTLVGCLQTSPAVLDSVSGSVESCFLHLFKHSFELLVVLSLSTINLLLWDLQQKSCISLPCVFFFCLYCHVGRASARNVFQPGRNDWNWTCLHGLYFLVDQIFKSSLIPSRSDWKWVHSGWIGSVSSDWVLTWGIFVLIISGIPATVRHFVVDCCYYDYVVGISWQEGKLAFIDVLDVA